MCFVIGIHTFVYLNCFYNVHIHIYFFGLTFGQIIINHYVQFVFVPVLAIVLATGGVWTIPYLHSKFYIVTMVITIYNSYHLVCAPSAFVNIII